MDPPDHNMSDPADIMPPEVSTVSTHNGISETDSHLAHYQSRWMDMPALHPCFNPRRQYP
jgi:hypothetical protein